MEKNNKFAPMRSSEIENTVKNDTKETAYVINDVYLNLSKKLKITKYIVLFALIVVVLIGIMNFSSHINIYSVREFFYSLGKSTVSINDNYVSISSSELVKADVFRDYLVMLRNDRIELYNTDGTRNMSRRIQMSKPTLKSSDRYMLLYDLGSYNLQLYNTVELIDEKKFDNTIYVADINDKGYFAVITHDVAYASQMLVFDNEMNCVFEWSSAYKYTPCMKMLNDDKSIVTASYFSKNGIPTTVLNLFNLKKETAITHEFSATLPLEVGQIKDGAYLLCTDRLIILDKEGNILKEISLIEYGSSVLEATTSANNIAISISVSNSTDECKVLVFSHSGELIYSKYEEFKIPSISLSAETLYYIHNGSLTATDITNKTVEVNVLKDSFFDLLCINNKLVLVSSEETLIYS